MAIGPAFFGDLGGAVGDLFASSADSAKADASLGAAQVARITGQADLLKAQGDTLEGAAYGEAATLAKLNATYTAQSTAVQEAQADRTLFGVLGGIKSNVAASGFSEGGSAGDILASSASQGALNRAVLGQQGLITEAGFEEQAQSYLTMKGAAGLAAQEDTLAAQSEQVTAQTDTQMAQAYQEASSGDIISGIFKGLAGVASLFPAAAAGGSSTAATAAAVAAGAI